MDPTHLWGWFDWGIVSMGGLTRRQQLLILREHADKLARAVVLHDDELYLKELYQIKCIVDIVIESEKAAVPRSETW